MINNEPFAPFCGGLSLTSRERTVWGEPLVATLMRAPVLRRHSSSYW